MGEVSQSTAPKWTPAQKRAIEDDGGTLLVSAAAGSGKTAVLVNRAMRLICREQDPVPAEQLLIVTFTNAAAAELRSRLSGQLSKQIAEERRQAHQKGESDSTGRLNFLRRQQMMLGRAAIGTIDSFCLQLLQQNFRGLDIPPDFTTADSSSLYTLKAQVLEEVLEEAYQDEEFCRFADLYGKSRSDAQAGMTILGLYDFLRSQPDYLTQLNGYVEQWQSDRPLQETVWGKYLVDNARQTLLEIEDYGKALLLAAEKATAAFPERMEKWAAAQQSELFELFKLKDLCQKENYDCFCEALRGWKWPTAPRVILKPKDSDDEATVLKLKTCARHKEEAGKLHAEIKKRVEELQQLLLTEEEYQQDRAEAAPLIAALARAVCSFDRKYFAAKVEKKQLEFSDFEHLALKLLWDSEKQQRTPLASQLSGRYRVVMVDEYQDTNRLQDRLYRCLATEAGDNLFFVGDIKQSVYSFRQADPDIFREKNRSFAFMEDPEQHNPAQSYPARIALDRNFRSSRGVIDAVNGIMGSCMTEHLGGVNYLTDKGEKLVAPESAPEAQLSCELHLAESEEGGDAWAVAKRIKEMLEQGFPVQDGNGQRACRPEDFCILLRTRKNFDAYVEALEQMGLTAYADVSENLLESPAVRPLISLLRVIDNPAQDVPLASVLLSPLGGMTPGELTRLRALHRQGGLYAAILPQWGNRNDVIIDPEYGPADHTRPESKSEDGNGWYRLAPGSTAEQKAEAFYDRLTLLRRLARTVPVDRLLDEIYTRTGYPALVGAMPGGAVRQDELQRFTDLICELGVGGLDSLIHTLDAMEESGQVEQSSTGSAGARPGRVSIMTIHRSKGLEYPIVILADTTRQFNQNDLRHPIVFHHELGIGLKLRGPSGLYGTVAHGAIVRRAAAELRSEEMRLLYVALTRAQQRLLLFVGTEQAAEAGKKAVLERTLEDLARALNCNAKTAKAARSNSFSVWLLLAALDNSAENRLWEKADTTREPGENLPNWPVEIYEEGNEAPDAQEAPLETEDKAKPDPKLCETLVRGLEWQYPHMARTRMTAKVSVTSLVHRQEETLMKRPAFLLKEGMTGAEKGTALHSFLQHADFALAASDPKAEAERQKNARLMEAEIYDKLDFEALERFFKSELFGRIQKAPKLLREYDFISAVPTAMLAQDEEKDELTREGESVLLQGVADLVLVYDDHVEIVDYKTDRGKTPDAFVTAYARQLQMYAAAIGKRLYPRPVTRCTLYSFALGQEISIPMRSGE